MMIDDAPPAPPATPASILCRYRLHRARPSELWNDGHYFSSCERCGTPLIRKPEERWHPIPHGLRLVWRQRTEDDIVWPTQVP